MKVLSSRWDRRTTTGAAVVALLAVLTAGCTAREDKPASPRNVVIVMVDSLRADHLGLYGYDAPTSPFLDSLAQESVVFERAYAPSSYTSQSVAAMLTGRLPTSGGSVGLLEAQPMEGTITLAERFRAAGYRTGVVSNQPLLRPRGFTRGFEDIQVASPEAEWTVGEVVRRGLDFVDLGDDASFLLYLHVLEPHQPYSPPESVRARFDGPIPETTASVPELQDVIESGVHLQSDDPRMLDLLARYDAEIASVDNALAALVDELSRRGIADDTLLIIAGSHGEEFLEHGYLGHAWSLYQEVLWVPLILHAPGLLEPARIDTPVSLVDLLPSLEALQQLPAQEARLDGVSFVSRQAPALHIRPPQQPKISELVIRERCILRAVMDGDWKYIAVVEDCPVGDRRKLGRDYPEIVHAMAEGSMPVPGLWGALQREELYELGDDPRELHDLAASLPTELARLRAVLVNYEGYCAANAIDAAQAVPRTRRLDATETERLESLGYL